VWMWEIMVPCRSFPALFQSCLFEANRVLAKLVMFVNYFARLCKQLNCKSLTVTVV
jgi:hypothetical protein